MRDSRFRSTKKEEKRISSFSLLVYMPGRVKVGCIATRLNWHTYLAFPHHSVHAANKYTTFTGKSAVHARAAERNGEIKGVKTKVRYQEFRALFRGKTQQCTDGENTASENPKCRDLNSFKLMIIYFVKMRYLRCATFGFPLCKHASI